MEVEFLSNMRYTLFASSEEWKEWHVKLSKFSEYYDKASRTQIALRNLALPVPQFSIPRDLPSPPASTNTSPPFWTNPAPNSSTLPHPLSMPPYLPPRIPSPESNLKTWARKRSLEESNLDPPPKRLNSLAASAASSATLTPSTLNNTPPVPRLPMPNLSISNNHQQHSFSSSPGQLPISAGRAMSTVFSGPSSRPQMGMQLPSIQPASRPSHITTSRHATSGDYPINQPPYTTATSTPSPTSYHFPQHTPSANGLSPSGWPVPRDSPYKPIRGVNTLLVPPPSASIQNHPQNVSHGQMHYQPLGKPTSERRTGVLPYFPPNTWTQSQQMQHY